MHKAVNGCLHQEAARASDFGVTVREGPSEVTVSVEIGRGLADKVDVKVCGRLVTIRAGDEDRRSQLRGGWFQAEVLIPTEVRTEHAIGEIVESQLVVHLPKAAPRRVPVLRDTGGSPDLSALDW